MLSASTWEANEKESVDTLFFRDVDCIYDCWCTCSVADIVMLVTTQVDCASRLTNIGRLTHNVSELITMYIGASRASTSSHHIDYRVEP